MTHAGLALVLAAFLVLAAGATTTAFGDLRAAAAALSPATRNVVFLLALLGFGSKAGIIPLHVWLPRAHPAAPSHVSALMSGVMIKLGVYGLLRVGLDLLGGGPAWWGALLIGLGAALGAARGALRPHGERPQATARLFERREYRARLHRPRRRLPLPESPGHPPRPSSPSRRLSTTP